VQAALEAATTATVFAAAVALIAIFAMRMEVVSGDTGRLMLVFATGLAGAALSRVAQAPRARGTFAITAGALSCVVGVLWAIPLVG
jgi:hypothetical protein